jgi:hypothetical protein
LLASARKLAALPMRDRTLLVEALGALLGARLALLFFPFRRVAGWLGTQGVEQHGELDAAARAETRRIGWAVAAAAKRVPWDSRCLVQAMAAAWMVRRRGIGGTLYFGLRREQDKPFSAHAWLRCGDRVVTGAGELETFKVIAMFSHDGAGRP